MTDKCVKQDVFASIAAQRQALRDASLVTPEPAPLYTLVEGDTTRRINGRHKEDGFHYPNCYADGDTLFVTYSVNKEDIEVLSVDMTQVD